MDFAEWLQHGKANGWLSTPEGHDSVDPETLDDRNAGRIVRSWDLDLGEWCAAHNEGLYCCLDHEDVYLVTKEQP